VLCSYVLTSQQNTDMTVLVCAQFLCINLLAKHGHDRVGLCSVPMY